MFFFSIIIQPSIHLPFHPSILTFSPSFSLACYNGPLWVDGRIYVGLCLWRIGENKGERDRDLKKNGRGNRSRAVSYKRLGWRVFVSLWGCPSQQLVPLNSVIEMTNRTAFLGFLQVKLAILSLASHSWSPRPWNWIWLWVHSWSDSMLVVRLFLESWVAVTLTWCPV